MVAFEREILDSMPETELNTTGAETDGAGLCADDADLEGRTMIDELETVGDVKPNDRVESETGADPGRELLMRVWLGTPLLGLVVPLSATVDTGSERRIN